MTRLRGLVVTYPPGTEETRAMGRKIESRQGICRVVAFLFFILNMKIWTICFLPLPSDFVVWALRYIHTRHEIESRCLPIHKIGRSRTRKYVLKLYRLTQSCKIKLFKKSLNNSIYNFKISEL
jgi:hypothetical protein